MKKLLQILGGIFAVLIVVAVIGFVVIARKGNALDKESKEYVDRVTPEILSSLSKDKLFEYANDELKTSGTDEQFQKMFAYFGKLGAFKKCGESKGQARIFVTPKTGERITGEYIAQADFEKGPATIKIATVKTQGKWYIWGFHIDSMVFADQ